MRLPFRRSSKSRAELLGKMANLAETGRRLAIYDQQSGFLAPWYMALRVTEECGRATRYSRPLSVLVMQVPAREMNDVRFWLGANLRSTDLICRVQDRYFVLLAETDEGGASKLAMRLLKDVTVGTISCAAFGREPERFRELLAPIHAREAAAA